MILEERSLKRTKCPCHGLPRTKTCPKCDQPLELLHIPGYFWDMGLPSYTHSVLVGTFGDIIGKDGWKRINKRLDEADKMCKYQEYPEGEPDKRFKCDNCGIWRGKNETVAEFRKKHNYHKIKLYWMPDDVRRRLEL